MPTNPNHSPDAPATTGRHAAPLPAVFPVLLAVTHDDAENAAVRVTKALARERGAVPTVLHVGRADMPAPETGVLASIRGVGEEELSPQYRNAQLAELESHVRGVLDIAPQWRFEVAAGDAVSSIVERARELGAELIVLGLPHRNALRRALVRDTVQGVAEHAASAVLAVRPALADLPEHVMVAVDFSPASLRAAHFARHVLAAGGTLELVYVRPESTPRVPADTARRAEESAGLDTAFASLIADLAPSPGMTVTPVVFEGSALEQVRTAAERLRPDLIAVGSGQHSTIDWFFGDSVSTELIDERRWSLLIVPQRARPVKAGVPTP